MLLSELLMAGGKLLERNALPEELRNIMRMPADGKRVRGRAGWGIERDGSPAAPDVPRHMKLKSVFIVGR